MKPHAAFMLGISLVLAFTNAAIAEEAVIPAGNYEIDKSHASLIFRVNHLGFSMYTARFTRFDASLTFDPANLAASRLDAKVDVASLETDFPSPDVIDFNEMLQNEQWLASAQYPSMQYISEKIELLGDKQMRVHGKLTLRGVTQPVVLEVTYNGGYAGHTMDPRARIGFSAKGKLKRSDFGMSYGIPEPGTTMGVSDEVEIIIEAEFSGPPFKG